MPFRLHRSLLFHLGLPGFLFLLWSWIDSMGTASSWNWIYGPAVTIPGAVSQLPKLDYRTDYHWRLDALPRTGSPCWSAGVKHGTLRQLRGLDPALASSHHLPHPMDGPPPLAPKETKHPPPSNKSTPAKRATCLS